MKIVILGGSSCSTPALFRCLGTSRPLPELEIVLVGRSAEHRNAVLRASRILLGEAPVALRSASFAEDEMALALTDADLVLIQVRFGGYEGRHFDETFPLRFGICGDEGLGPGGLSAGWRAWPKMRSLLARVQSICPHALVLMVSSPLVIFVGAAHLAFPKLRVVGICELPWTTLLDVAAQLQVNIAEVNFDYIGLNHLGWLYGIQLGTRDLLEEYRDKAGSKDIWPGPALIDTCEGLPTKYLRLHYYPRQVLAQQQAQPSRAAVLKNMSVELYRCYQYGDEQVITAALGRRPTPWYEHAIVPFLLAWTGGEGTIPFFVTSYQHGSGVSGLEVPGEVPVWIVQRSMQPQRSRKPVPQPILEVLRAFATYERQAITAITSEDADGLREALRIHPWIATPNLAADLARIIAGQQCMAA